MDQLEQTLPLSNKCIPSVAHFCSAAGVEERLGKAAHYEGETPSIIESADCNNHKYYDGIWNTVTSTWQLRPCKRKNCKRHWRLYAKPLYYKLKKKLPQKEHWYHARCSLMRPLKPKERTYWLSRFMNKIQKKISSLTAVVFFHSSKNKNVHLHCLFGSDEVIDPTIVRQAWQAHFPSKKLTTFKPQHCMFKEHKHPNRLIGYCLLGRRKKPRLLPPYFQLKLAYPYRLYGDILNLPF